MRLVVTRFATDRWRAKAFRARRAAGLTVDPGKASDDGAALLDAVVLTSAMRQLPVDQRRALAMHYLLDMPITDIATETGVAAGTVKSWLARGRAALAQALSTVPTTAGGRDV